MMNLTDRISLFVIILHFIYLIDCEMNNCRNIDDSEGLNVSSYNF